MGRTRFYSPKTSFSSDGKTVTLGSDEARHLREVLRARVGDEVFVFDGEGCEFQCVVTDARRASAQLDVTSEVLPAKPESPLQLTLGVALLKGEKFDLLVQKATELGVTRIVPIITTRADVRLRDISDADKRVSRWQRIAAEACKQSGRAQLPAVVSPQTFSSLLEEASDNDSRVFLFSERDGITLESALKKAGPTASVVALIGAEGGWTDEELEEARKAGCELVTLGGRVLRAETAAIIVTGLLQNHLGDLI